MANFSGATMLADLDYIAPSQACVKPMLLSQKQVGQQSGALQPQQGGLALHGSDTTADIVKISLQDCLACSGCVTTAETMLVTSQSRPQIASVLAGEEAPRPRAVVVSISDQSAASLAARWGVPVETAFAVVSGFCRAEMAATAVIDLRWAQRVCLEATAAEYMDRLCNGGVLPMIASSCPGWVCYCEKTHPTLLPHVSRVMSPQAIAGKYSKQQLLQPGEDPSAVYHISVQPCFDKKLEAARSDLASEERGRDTDCVLSTQELFEWMVDVNPQRPWSAPLDSTLERLRGSTDACTAAELEGSGGFHQYLMQHAAGELGMPAGAIAMPRIEYQVKRNANHRVAQLPGLSNPATGKPLLFGVAYGFQHIQNVVRSLKRKTAATPDYTFIELMACPDGCLNGGGQVRATDPMENRKQLEGVMAVFQEFTARSATQVPASPPAADSDDDAPARKQHRQPSNEPARAEPYTSRHVYDAWLQAPRGSLDAVRGLSTEYHDRQAEMQAMENNVASLRW